VVTWLFHKSIGKRYLRLAFELCSPPTQVAVFKERAAMLIREYLESGSVAEACASVALLLASPSGRAGEGDRRRLLRHLVRGAVDQPSRTGSRGVGCCATWCVVPWTSRVGRVREEWAAAPPGAWCRGPAE
jgi:hypothetical protein